MLGQVPKYPAIRWEVNVDLLTEVICILYFLVVPGCTNIPKPELWGWTESPRPLYVDKLSVISICSQAYTPDPRKKQLLLLLFVVVVIYFYWKVIFTK